jgi:hypothetical protein
MQRKKVGLPPAVLAHDRRPEETERLTMQWLQPLSYFFAGDFGRFNGGNPPRAFMTVLGVGLFRSLGSFNFRVWAAGLES